MAHPWPLGEGGEVKETDRIGRVDAASLSMLVRASPMLTARRHDNDDVQRVVSAWLDPFTTHPSAVASVSNVAARGRVLIFSKFPIKI